MGAHIGDLHDPRHRPNGFRHQHLPAMTRSRNAGRGIQHRPEMVTVTFLRLPHMQTNANPQNRPWPPQLAKLCLDRECGADRSDARPNAAANESPALENT